VVKEEIDAGKDEGAGLKNETEEGWLGRLKRVLRRASRRKEVEEGR
jgi:hypothetical protein